MRFRVHDGACDALLSGAIGTLAGHPGGAGSRLTCGCGHPDCPHPTPKAPPPPEKPERDGGDDGEAAPEAPPEPPRIGHLWLDFAEDQLTEQKRAERGTLPEPQRAPEACPTCDGGGIVQMQARRSADGAHLELDVVATHDTDTEIVIPHGMTLEAEDVPAFYPPPADPIDFSQPVVIPGGPTAADVADDDAADFELDDEAEPEPLVPELLEVQCPTCKGTGVAPPPPPPLIPNNPLLFRAGIRADLVERVDAAGGYGA